ncbi:MAG TPA: SHOCT domain-containing protein [Solirubrobacteraceae bacterium]
MRAAMIGGGAYAVGKHNANKNAEEAAGEADQEARLEALEAQQQAGAAPPPPPPPPAAAPVAPAPVAAAPGAGGDLVGQLTELKGLLDAGALSQDEFDAAKAKLLQS